MSGPQSTPIKDWVFGALLPAALFAAGYLTYLGLGASKPKQIVEDLADPRVILAKLPIVSVDSVRPFEGLRSLDVHLTGTVVPDRQVTLASEVAGRIVFKSEGCRIGNYVHEGDVLFRVDPQDYELEVERLSALRESEYAQQHELDQELSNVQRSLALAEEELVLQGKEMARIEALPSGFASDTEKDQAKRQRIVSANQVVTLQNQMQLLESRRKRIELGERLAQAQLSQAEVNLERSEIKTPVSGVIVSESVQEDSYVQKATPLCVIEDTERVEVSCSLRTDQLLLILDQIDGKSDRDASSRVVRSSSYELPRTPVEISYRVSGRDDLVYQWRGHLSRYEGIGLDSQSRTVPVRITVDNPRDVRRNGEKIEEDNNGGLPALVRGMFVDIAIQTQPRQNLVLLPKLTVKPGGQVWVFQPDPTILNPPPASPDASAKELGSTQGISTKNSTGPTSNDLPSGSQAIVVNDWIPGRVGMLNGVKTISLIRLPPPIDAEYWVCEAREDLGPGTQAIISPLANLIGDGQDKVRLSIKQDSRKE